MTLTFRCFRLRCDAPVEWFVGLERDALDTENGAVIETCAAHIGAAFHDVFGIRVGGTVEMVPSAQAGPDSLHAIHVDHHEKKIVRYAFNVPLRPKRQLAIPPGARRRPRRRR